MSKRRIAAIAAVALIGVALAALAAGGAWVFHTTAGLQWLAARTAGFAGEGLDLEGVAGTLAGGARVRSIRYTGEDIEVRVHDARLAVSPLSVLTLSPHIEGLGAARVEVTTKPSEDPAELPDTLELPVNFSVDNAHIGELVIALGKDPIELSNVRLDYAGGRSKHTVSNLTLSAMGYAVSLRGRIDAQAPFALEASVAAVGHAAPAVTAFGKVTGNLTELTFDGGALAPGARASATATVRPYDESPLAAASARAKDVDLAAVDPALPRTALTVELDLARSGATLRGPLVVRNAIPGPYDKARLPLAALRAELATNLATVGFTALQADLGAAGTITGSGTVEPEKALLTLQTRRLDLQALYTSMRATQLAGRAELTLREARQSVVASLAQDDLALNLTAHRAGDQIDVPSFRATARGGVAAGSARVNLAEPQPFSLEASLRRFDPSAWGDFPAGSINATASAEGSIAGPSADVRFAIRDSRWLGAPLAGNGHVRGSSERLQRADVDVTLGGNRLQARGAFGAPGDALSVELNAPRLALIDRQLRGTLRGTARITGEWRTPRVQFDATGSSLAHERYGAVKSLSANGVVSLQAQGTIEARAALTGVSTPQGQLRSATLELDGTRAAHTALLQALGERIDFRVRARGGWNPESGWRGTVLELANRGEVPIELSGPVTLAVGPARVQAEPFELRAVGGRLTVKALDYSRGQLTTAGTLQNLPVTPLIALAGKPSAIGGNLRLSGSWDLRSAPQLLGTIALAHESGDLVVGGEGKITLGLRSLSVTAQLGARETVFKAAVESMLASARAEGRLGAVGGATLVPYTAASPLTFTASADIARLASVAAFIDTPMLVDGKATARLQGGGTLGDPQITGRVTAEGLGLALPAQGVSLTGGSLTALLTEREIRLESFSIRGGDGVLTASGTLARTGFDRASVNWSAERFTALARPDRKLVVSGKGNAALEGGKLSLTGNVRANEGEFQISGSGLPTLSDDVVIVGREPRRQPQDAQPAALKGVALDLRIDLGNQVHITGLGLSVWLSGDVRVYTNARGDVLASGAVNARNGTFVAYGQRLEIERGRLYFNGPVANPGLDIVALRKRQAVEAGVAVTGTLRNPLVRVVSNPPLPQGEALSWLVLGRAPGEAGAGELSALPLATGVLAGKVTDPLAKRLSLDELALSGSGAVGEQFLTLGKRITDRLYIAFDQGLGTAESLLRLEYTLTRRVVVRLQAGEPTSAGVFYRRSWD